MAVGFAFSCPYFLFSFRYSILTWIKPATDGLVQSLVADFAFGKMEIIVKNALLRQQLIVVRRIVKPPALSRRDCFVLVVVASKVR